jgi:hypothetical protein
MRHEERGPSHGAPLETTVACHHSKDSGLAHGTTPGRQDEPAEVFGFAAEPAGRRSMWAVVVPRCCWCLGLHIHRSTGAHGGRRTGSCGKEYVVVLAGRRKGAA